jgi:hypothetical protein
MNYCPTNTHVPSEQNEIKNFADAIWPCIAKFETLLTSLKIAHANLGSPCRDCVEVGLLDSYKKRTEEVKSEWTRLVGILENMDFAIDVDRSRWPGAEGEEVE